ncbi:hypothetical protein AB6A40_001791 [Gnathostoma spinigerum]|uniref:Zinc transporter ZIP14 n=1 Tax=Gnathostoma spinigerum TaxID=75299 RepID=A0ABD6EEZ0_9BILA
MDQSEVIMFIYFEKLFLSRNSASSLMWTDNGLIMLSIVNEDYQKLVTTYYVYRGLRHQAVLSSSFLVSFEFSAMASFLDLINTTSPINGTRFCLDFLSGNAVLTNLSGAVLFANAPPETWKVWTFGLLTVTVISLCAAVGIILIPLLSPQMYDRSMTYFVALGVGSLSGCAVFHLIPEAFDLDEILPDYFHKSWMVIGGIYLFFLVDKILSIVQQLQERSAVNPGDERPPMTKQTFDDVEVVARSHSPVSLDRRVSTTSHKHISSIAWLVIFGDGLHNFIDGLSIGASFHSSIRAGLGVALAVICEELPHELGDCAILINSGMSLMKALFYNLASASTCYAGFVVGVCAGKIDDRSEGFILALAAGMFLYISLAGMLSEMNKKSEEKLKVSVKTGLGTMLMQFAGLATGILIMYVTGKYGDKIIV